VIGLAHQRISEAYEASDPKLLVQQPSSLFKDFDDKRSALSPSELEERDAIDALRDMTGMKKDESEKTKSKRAAALKELEAKRAAEQATWKDAEELEQKGIEGKTERKAREKKAQEEEKERLAEEERKRLAEEERKRVALQALLAEAEGKKTKKKQETKASSSSDESD